MYACRNTYKVNIGHVPIHKSSYMLHVEDRYSRISIQDNPKFNHAVLGSCTYEYTV